MHRLCQLHCQHREKPAKPCCHSVARKNAIALKNSSHFLTAAWCRHTANIRRKTVGLQRTVRGNRYRPHTIVHFAITVIFFE
jgi:hypothetical protein